jgi:hypothetical protein
MIVHVLAWPALRQLPAHAIALAVFAGASAIEAVEGAAEKRPHVAAAAAVAVGTPRRCLPKEGEQLATISVIVTVVEEVLRVQLCEALIVRAAEEGEGARAAPGGVRVLRAADDAESAGDNVPVDAKVEQYPLGLAQDRVRGAHGHGAPAGVGGLYAVEGAEAVVELASEATAGHSLREGVVWGLHLAVLRRQLMLRQRSFEVLDLVNDELSSA